MSVIALETLPIMLEGSLTIRRYKPLNEEDGPIALALSLAAHISTNSDERAGSPVQLQFLLNFFFFFLKQEDLIILSSVSCGGGGSKEPCGAICSLPYVWIWIGSSSEMEENLPVWLLQSVVILGDGVWNNFSFWHQLKKKNKHKWINGVRN